MKTRISDGNSKVGRIPNISLTPGRTCSAEACRTCLAGGCYAMKSYRMYPSVRRSWDANTDLAINDLATMERELTAYFGSMVAPRFFRIHVAGDFVHREYAQRNRCKVFKALIRWPGHPRPDIERMIKWQTQKAK